MIERNLHPAGRIGNIVFGFAAIGDGLVRVLSLGFLHSRFTLTVARNQTLRSIDRLKKKGKT